MHYVCADIHGQFDDFMQILEMINFNDNDVMFILGDAIDRGPRPIDVLRYIKDHKNMIFLIGNHEDLMIQSELYDDRSELYTWMLNGAETTLQQMCDISKKEKQDLLIWLTEQKIIIPDLEVAGRKYYLTHACHTLTDDHESIIYKDTSKSVIKMVTWDRTYKSPAPEILDYRFHNLYLQYPDTTLIIGHSPVQNCPYGITLANGSGRISRTRHGHLINVDCGCAKGKALGCLRLEDGKEFYAKHKSVL